MRVAIIGSSGSGKTTLAKAVAAKTGAFHIEIDAYFHQEGWEPKDSNLLRVEIAAELERSSWVCDGNYTDTLGDLIHSRADTIVVFDLPRRQVLGQVVRRTVRRAVKREELWNGNREPLTNFTRWNPEKNIIRWSWVHHDTYRQRFQELEQSGAWDHADVVTLRSHADGNRWLAAL